MKKWKQKLDEESKAGIKHAPVRTPKVIRTPKVVRTPKVIRAPKVVKTPKVISGKSGACFEPTAKVALAGWNPELSKRDSGSDLFQAG